MQEFSVQKKGTENGVLKAEVKANRHLETARRGLVIVGTFSNVDC
jgi:hypothetical protein